MRFGIAHRRVGRSRCSAKCTAPYGMAATFIEGSAARPVMNFLKKEAKKVCPFGFGVSKEDRQELLS